MDEGGIRAGACGAPRVCGDDPARTADDFVMVQVLPAYAGMIPRSGAGCSGRRRAPRVCGDDPARIPSPTQAGVCSPRMRG